MPRFLGLGRAFSNRILRTLGMPERRKIFILPDGSGGVVFLPDVRGAENGDPLRANIGDLVSWTNRTDRKVALQAVPPGSIPNFDREIDADRPSDFFQIGALPITYRCESPLKEHTIEGFSIT
jgi:hypothetical protein